MTPEGTPEQRVRLFSFLRGLGLGVEEVHLAKGFIRGVRIVRGVLHVDPTGSVDAVLHEAGHLCLVPKPFRAWVGTNIDAGLRRMFRALARVPLNPDGLLHRAAVQCGEVEATAWAWAAGHHLGFPPELVILDTSYGNTGSAVRDMLAMKGWMGIHGLAHAGLCTLGRGGTWGPDAYPFMHCWVQDGPFPEWPDAPAAPSPPHAAPGR